ncbi:flagellar filament capping protein FliD [Ralstonia flaminis]|jgi:flagellar hook-associated protein 2|uniref:Flagellar hook-associated protein 2 n=1 Tax=Ralstonia flaminis TaxID=3058597 RepID=A0ABN9JSG0_9RALS|nr:flagellar filament capping protein FliD [Ralstonia sp. LMG 18101]CAJ0819443.1 B-type flagellar hook-associated protein 2 [Ralstonia sp. LMG 18101]
MFNIGDPATNAQAFTDLYMQNALLRLKSQKATNAAQQDALGKLRNALSSFQTSLLSLSGASSIVKQKATLSNPSLGSATVGASAQPGSYSFFVERLASAHQIAYQGVPPYKAEDAGTLKVALDDGTSFDVDLSGAKADASGNVSPAELARAINQSPDNAGKVAASIVTINGEQRLVLTSGQTGEAGGITLDTSGVDDPALAAVLSGRPQELAAASDAVFRLGGESGEEIKQASNTFTGIEGVSVTFTQAMVPGDAPLRLEVELDKSGTTEAVQAFVDAYNEVMNVLAELTKTNPDNPAEAGPFVGDAGVRGLQQRMNDLLRGAVGDARLMDFGISADRNGKLSLDTEKLEAGLAKNPKGLDALFADGDTGIAKRMDDYLKTWTSSVDGHLKRRQDSSEVVEKSLNKKELSLDAKYSQVYNRYLAQFTRVSELQSRMEFTMSLLESLPEIGGGKK